MTKKLRVHNIDFDYDTKVFGKSTDVRIYHDAVMIAPGSHTDSITMSPVEYTPELLQRTVNNIQENYLNIDHSHETLKRIGRFVNPYWDGEKVRADLYIYPVTQNSRDTIELIDNGLVNWLSVELITEDGWNHNNERYVKDLEYIGLAVVTAPACRESKIDDFGEDPPNWLYE